MTKVWGMKEWVENWKQIGPALQEQRDNDIRNSNSSQSIEQLSWSYQYARDNYVTPSTSGMVDFYKILLKHPR